jgi:hypothetical protein
MAAIKSLKVGEIKRLKASVVAGLRDYGIKAEADLEPSGLPGRYRLYVVSKDFAKLREAERQDVLWRVIKDRWTREDQLRITLSLALTEKEAGVS